MTLTETGAGSRGEQLSADERSAAAKAPTSLIVPLREKVAYGAAGVTDFLYLNLPLAMATPIFSVKLGMSTALLGISMAIAKALGALVSPIIGARSDNLRGRWGRRKPFMAVGAVVGAIAMPLLWFPPSSTWWMFAYVTFFITAISVFSSVYSIPYNALGLELTSDYDDRTRVQAWKGYLQTVGILASAWFYWFTLQPLFANEVVGVRWLSGIVALVMIGGAAWSLKVNCPITQTQTHRPIPILPAVWLTLKNRPFMILLGSSFILSFSQACTGVLGQYIHIFYSCHGDKALASRISGFGGTLTIFTALLAMPLGLWLSERFGKREAAAVSIGIAFAVALSLFWTINPRHPYLLVLPWMVNALAIPSYGLLFSSMLADVCDEDELSTGMRREGIFCAVNLLQNRVMLVIMLGVGGALPMMVGYGYRDSQASPSMNQLIGMKGLLIAIQCVGALAALALVLAYPIDRRRSIETRAALQARQGRII